MSHVFHLLHVQLTTSITGPEVPPPGFSAKDETVSTNPRWFSTQPSSEIWNVASHYPLLHQKIQMAPVDGFGWS